jgi:CBS domain-containing protein
MIDVRRILNRKGREVHTIGPDDTVLQALERMARHDVGALVVLDGDEVVGLLSERDYARKVILRGRFSQDTSVREIMATEPTSVGPDHSIEECMALMTDRRTRHLPVLEEGQLAGLISIGDAVKAVIEDREATIQELNHYIQSG